MTSTKTISPLDNFEHPQFHSSSDSDSGTSLSKYKECSFTFNNGLPLDRVRKKKNFDCCSDDEEKEERSEKDTKQK